jgi:kynurenine formamidase
LNKEDLLITKELLQKKLSGISKYFLKGLIIRTLPNLERKKSQDYMKLTPAFFSIDAMDYIREIGVKHLLVDTPSVDRLFDNGILSAHNTFWNTQDKEYNSKTKNKTITEMIFVENQILDGKYLLNIQIPAFVADAAPSRPIIFKINDL